MPTEIWIIMSSSITPIPLRLVLRMMLAIDPVLLKTDQLLSWLQSGHHAISYVLTLNTDKKGEDHIYNVEQLEVVKREGNLYTFHVTHTINNAGSFKIAYRIFPKNERLPHRQDFCYVKWFL